MTRRCTRKPRAFLLAVLVVLSVFAGVTAFGGTVTAANDGTIVVDASAGNDGYTTISGAIDDAGEGTTIEVKDGTYPEQVTVDKDVTLKAVGDPTIRYAPDDPSGQPTVKITANGSSVSGFTVERNASDQRGSGTSPAFTQGIRISASHVTVSDNDVVGAGFDDLTNKGVMVIDDESGDATGETVRNVTLSNNHVSGFQGAFSIVAYYGGDVSDVTLTDNTFDGNDANGISVDDAGGTVNVDLGEYDPYNVTTDLYDSGDPEWYFGSDADATDFANASDVVVSDGNGTYYVGKGASIQDGINATSDGDTVTVSAGTYEENVTIKSDDLTLQGAGPSETTIEGQVFVPSEAEGLAVGSVTGLNMSGFRVVPQGADVSGDVEDAALDIQTGGSGDTPQQNLTFTNNTLLAPGTGFAVFHGGNTQNIDYENNTFSVYGNNTATKLVFVGGERSYGEDRSSSAVNFTDNVFEGGAEGADDGNAVGLEHEGSHSRISDNNFSAVSSGAGVVTGDPSNTDSSGTRGLILATFGNETTIISNTGLAVRGETAAANIIQPVIDFAGDGETVEVREGTYEGDVAVAKPLTIEGAGRNATVIDTAGGGHAISVSASNVTIRDLNATNGNTGIDVPRTANVSDFRLKNVVLSQNTYGIYVHGDTVNTDDDDNGEFDGIHFRNVRITDSEEKGMYIEKLSNATFDGVVVDGVTSDTYGFNNGIDINLKDGDYENVTIENSVVRNVSKGQPYDGTDSFSAAIAIKARDDEEKDYGSDPGTLDDVTLDNVTVEKSFNGLRFGEPGSTNAEPTNVTVRDSTFHNNTGYHVSVETESLDLHELEPEGASNQFDRFVTVSNSSPDGPEDFKNTLWTNVGDALDAAESGEFVTVHPGVYEETLQIRTENVTVAGREGAEIVAPDGTAEDRMIDIRASNVTVAELVVTGNGNDTSPQGIFIGGGSAQNTTVWNNTVRNVSTGIQTTSSSWARDSVIDSNTVSNTGFGISIQANETTTTNNTITNVDGGIGFRPENTGLVVEDNAVSNVSGDHHIGVPSGVNGVTGAEYEIATELLDSNPAIRNVKANDRLYNRSIINVDSRNYHPSIQHAIGNVSSGDEIFVKNGTYSETISITTENITLGGGDNAIITGQINFGRSYPDDIEINGFDFTGEVDQAIQANGAGDNLTVANNTFDGPSTAVATGGSNLGNSQLQTGWIISNNHVKQAGVDHDRAAFQLWVVDDVTVYNNTVENTSLGGVSLRWVETATVGENTFNDTRRAGVFVTSFGNQNAGEPASNVVVANNTFSNAGDPADPYTQAAILIDGTVENRSAVAVHNNRITEFRTHGVWVLKDENTAATGHVNATYNYWGAPTGPGAEGPGEGANVSENVTFVPFYTDASLTQLSTAPPQLSEVMLTDVTDGNGVVDSNDTLRVSARATDPTGVDAVTVDAQPFGGSGTLALTDENDDDVYDAEFTVDADAATSPDGRWALTVTANDSGGTTASASTNAVTLETDSETTTSYTVSDTTPLSTDVVSVNVSVENVGNRSTDRTVTLLVDGEAVANRSVTVPEGATRAVTFERKFDYGQRTVTVNDSVATLANTTITAVRPTNPDADVAITSPTAGDVFPTENVTVAYDLRNVDSGISNLTYEVDGGPTTNVSDLNETNVTLTGLSDGEHTVTLTLVDNVGNEVIEDAVTFNVDVAEPVVSIDPGRDSNVGANRSVDVDLTVTEENPDTATFAVRNDSGRVYTRDVSDELVDGTATVTWDGMTNDGTPAPTGEYDLVLNATDAGGLSNETAATVSVDNAPASVEAIISDTTALGSGDSVTVDVTASDSESSVRNVTVTLVADDVNYRTTSEASSAGGSWMATFDATDLEVDGTYSIEADAMDAANNEGSGTNGSAIEVDTTAPSVSTILDTKNGTHGYVNVTAAEDVQSANDISLDLTNPSDSSVTVSGLADPDSDGTYSGTFQYSGNGQYDLEANATDEFGNEGGATATANFSELPADDRHTITGADGSVVVLNMSSSTGGLAAITTADAPLAELGTNVGETFLNGELNESLENDLENATIRIPVNGNVPPGVDDENVEIRRYDPATGDWESISETDIVEVGGTRYFSVTVNTFSTYGTVAPDTEPPSIDATDYSPTSPVYGTDTVDVTVEYSDNKQVDAGNVTVRFDGTDVTDDAATSVSPTEATYSASGLVGSGTHWLNVTAVDSADNVETANVSFTVPRDTQSPTITDEFADQYDYGTTSVPIEFSFSDDQSGVDADSITLTVDGSTVSDANATITASGLTYDATGLAPGTHTAEVTVSDEDGNQATDDTTFTIEGDTDTPTVTNTTVSGTGNDLVLPVGTTQTTISLEYADDTSGINASAIEVTFDGEDVTDETLITDTDLEYTVLGLRNGTTYTLSTDIVDNEGNRVTETITFDVASPPSDDADGDDDDTVGSTGGGGGGPVSITRTTTYLENGEAELNVGEEITALGVTFPEGGTGSVTAQEVSERPDSVPTIPDATGVAFVDVTVPEELTDSEATVEITVDADTIGDASPDDLSVYHYADGEWSTLETSVVDSDGDAIVLEATTPGFSLFAVGTPEETDGQVETPEDESIDTPSDGVSTDQPDETPGEVGTEDVSGTDDAATDDPVEEPGGFDLSPLLIVVLLIGVIAAGYLAWSRSE